MKLGEKDNSGSILFLKLNKRHFLFISAGTII